jgi:hypothetical protein
VLPAQQRREHQIAVVLGQDRVDKRSALAGHRAQQIASRIAAGTSERTSAAALPGASNADLNSASWG